MERRSDQMVADRPGWSGVQPPTQAQCDSLLAALAEHTALYEEKIQPIRHKAFAHAGRITQEELHAMFAAVPVADFERPTVFPLRPARHALGDVQ